jgi:hypothetical protein
MTQIHLFTPTDWLSGLEMGDNFGLAEGFSELLYIYVMP